MQTEYLVIGQGISGTFLTWYLNKARRDFIVIDKLNPSSSSRVAAGIINPVTGRRIVKTWMIDTLLPYAFESYSELGAELNINAIKKTEIVNFFPSPQMLIEFSNRVQEDMSYISMPADANSFTEFFNYDFGYGIVSPAYAVNLAEILPSWRATLGDRLIDDEFNLAELRLGTENISYRNITAKKIIFCDGVNSFDNPWFSKLPFAQNKGQALVIRNTELPKEFIYKKAMTIVPLKDDFFWVGSSYEWDFEHEHPSEEFLNKTVAQLSTWIKSPFTVEAHLSSMRPATLERRPFVGMHPAIPQVAILNGMGTKGCSLAPWFANQLMNNLVTGSPVLPEADISRFKRILSS